MTKFRLLGASAIALVAAPLSAAPSGDFSPERRRAHVQTLGSDAYFGPSRNFSISGTAKQRRAWLTVPNIFLGC